MIGVLTEVGKLAAIGQVIFRLKNSRSKGKIIIIHMQILRTIVRVILFKLKNCYIFTLFFNYSSSKRSQKTRREKCQRSLSKRRSRKCHCSRKKRRIFLLWPSDCIYIVVSSCFHLKSNNCFLVARPGGMLARYFSSDSFYGLESSVATAPT